MNKLSPFELRMLRTASAEMQYYGGSFLRNAFILGTEDALRKLPADRPLDEWRDKLKYYLSHRRSDWTFLVSIFVEDVDSFTIDHRSKAFKATTAQLAKLGNAFIDECITEAMEVYGDKYCSYGWFAVPTIHIEVDDVLLDEIDAIFIDKGAYDDTDRIVKALESLQEVAS